MFNFVEFDIDDKRSEFLRSLAYRGSWPPTYVVVSFSLFCFCFRLCCFLVVIYFYLPLQLSYPILHIFGENDGFCLPEDFS
jgi:hypothetical protein